MSHAPDKVGKHGIALYWCPAIGRYVTIPDDREDIALDDRPLPPSPLRSGFWVRDRVHPDPAEWVATFAGLVWQLRKRPAVAPDGGLAGWYLHGTDLDGSPTRGVWLGQRVGAAKRWGWRWIARPHERDEIRREVHG